ncbi:MAG: pilus assembly protein PilM [Candidatus Competibacteraceae bacterium]|nr:pilus assembly protein PilM [Candidatus Competibacteraceae bacterium]
MFTRYWPAELNIGVFFRWWGAGLWACLPVSLRQRYVRVSRRWVLEIAADEIVLSREQAGEKPEILNRYPRQSLRQGGISEAVLKKTKGEPLVMRVPAVHTLSKTMTLPLAAESNLRQVVGFELDRFTPFTATQVYYDVRILERQSAARRLRVQLVAVPRSVLDSLLEQLAGAGLSPMGVDVIGYPEINLLPPSKRARQSATLQRLQWTLATLGLILVLAVGVFTVMAPKKCGD